MKRMAAQILVNDGDLVGLLDDLKRIRHVGDAGNSRKIALAFRVERRALFEVHLLLRERRRLIGDGAPFHHATPGGYAEARAVVFEVPRGRVEDLPDALQVRMPVPGARRRVGCRRRGLPHARHRRERAGRRQAEYQPHEATSHRRTSSRQLRAAIRNASTDTHFRRPAVLLRRLRPDCRETSVGCQPRLTASQGV